MGKHCCSHNSSPDHHLTHLQKRTLFILLGFNLLMLVIELYGTYVSRSAGVLADSVHLLSHVLVAFLSLHALSRDGYWRDRIALFKGIFMVVLGCGGLEKRRPCGRIAACDFLPQETNTEILAAPE